MVKDSYSFINMVKNTAGNGDGVAVGVVVGNGDGVTVGVVVSVGVLVGTNDCVNLQLKIKRDIKIENNGI